jgi:hypothetical protein
MVTPEGEFPISVDAPPGDIPDGMMFALPYRFDYADENTAAEGSLKFYFTWQAASQQLVAANPAVVLSLYDAGDDAYVSGRVVNSFADALSGGTGDNGWLSDVLVVALDSLGGVVASTTSGADGSFVLGPIPGGATYVLEWRSPGFVRASMSAALAPGEHVTGMQVYLNVIPTETEETTMIFGVVADFDGPLPGATPLLRYSGTSDQVRLAQGARSNYQGEFGLWNVPLNEGLDYEIAIAIGSRVVVGPTISVTSSDPVFANVFVPNHRARVLCLDASSGLTSTVALNVAPGSSTELRVEVSDADDDPIVRTITTATGGSIWQQPGLPGTHPSIWFTAPQTPGMYVVSVGAIDDTMLPGQQCVFNITVPDLN